MHAREMANGSMNARTAAIPKTLASLLPNWWSHVLFSAPQCKTESPRGAVWAGLLLVTTVAAGLLYPNLSYPLLEPDEGRYAEIGREMLVSGNWLVPTLYYQPYYDKPPLLYWAVAASFKIGRAHV